MKSLFLVLILAVCLVSCKSKQPGNVQQVENKSVELAKKGKYSLKSGIVHYRMNAMGIDMKYTLYFDDHGAKESTEAIVEMMGIKSQTITITKDGYVYTFDPEKKTGNKSGLTPQNGSIDFENLTEELKKEMKVEIVGEEAFLGKQCTKYAIDYQKFNMKGWFLVWNGIPLKSAVEIGPVKSELTADNINENVAIPSSKFEIPTDIKFE